jgi:hypothetical protein
VLGANLNDGESSSETQNLPAISKKRGDSGSDGDDDKDDRGRALDSVFSERSESEAGGSDKENHRPAKRQRRDDTAEDWRKPSMNSMFEVQWRARSSPTGTSGIPSQ